MLSGGPSLTSLGEIYWIPAKAGLGLTLMLKAWSCMPACWQANMRFLNVSFDALIPACFMACSNNEEESSI